MSRHRIKITNGIWAKAILVETSMFQNPVELSMSAFWEQVGLQCHQKHTSCLEINAVTSKDSEMSGKRALL